jgi:hypothetical protein
MCFKNVLTQLTLFTKDGHTSKSIKNEVTKKIVNISVRSVVYHSLRAVNNKMDLGLDVFDQTV